MEVRPRVAAHFSYYAAVTLSQRVLGICDFFAAKAKNRRPETNQTNDNYNMMKLWLQWKNCRFLRRNSPFCSQIARTQVITAGRPFFGASRDRAGNPVDGQWSVCGRCLGLRGCGGTVSCVCVTFISIHPSGRIAQEVFFIFSQIFSSSPKGVCVLLTVFCGVPKREKGSFPSLLLKSSHPSGIGSRIFRRKMLPRHPEGAALRATSFSFLIECRAWTRTRAAILRVAAVKKTSRGLVFRRSPPVRRFSNVTPLVAGARCEQAHTSTAAQSCTSPDTVGTPSPKTSLFP